MPSKRKPPIESAGNCSPPPDQPQFLRASDHPGQSVDWLWPEKIPIGKVTLLIGDPGNGKSLVALDIAARVSRAAPWPDDRKAEGGGRKGEGKSENVPISSALPPSALRPPPSSVILLSAEDELADTIRPRLDAAEADCERIFFLPAIADLRHDFAQLRAAVNRAPNCRLVVIDPVNAYVGPTDSHFQTVVRKVLQPLAKLASEKRLAVLAVAHLRKNDGAAIYRTAGSMGFVAMARAVWTVCRDQANAGRHMFLPLKNNLSADAHCLAFTIQSRRPNGAPAITWNPLAVTIPAADVIASSARKRGPEAVELNAACDWLRQALARGPRPALELAEAAAQLGFHERTLRRALHAIGGDTHYRGLVDRWWWSINPKPKAGDCRPEKPVPSKETCPLPGIFTDHPAAAGCFGSIQQPVI